MGYKNMSWSWCHQANQQAGLWTQYDKVYLHRIEIAEPSHYLIA